MSKVNPDLLDDEVLSSIISNLGYDHDTVWEDDDLASEALNKVSEMSVFEAFNRYLTWHGMIGFTEDIIKALDSIRESSKET